MKRWIYGLLAAVCLALLTIPVARAADIVDFAVEGGNIKFDKSTGTVTGCDKSVTKAVIPDIIDTVQVKTIGNAAFQFCHSVTSVTVPNGVTFIGGSAFFYCDSLTDITIPDSVTQIGDSAFYQCSKLRKVNIPSNLTSIGKNAFYGCASLTGINIPDGVTTIDGWAFTGCTGLTSVSIPNNVTTIGTGAFSATGLTSVFIPSSVTTIGGNPFSNCAGLNAITVAGDNPSFCSIGGVLFEKADMELRVYPGGKSGAYSAPNGVTAISPNAFFRCTVLTSVSIPNSVTTIGLSAFNSCTSLTDVYYDGTQAEYEANLRPNVDNRNNENDIFLNANFHFNDSPSPTPPPVDPNPAPNPTLPNTAANDNTMLFGIVFLILASLTLTVWALGRKRRKDEST